MTHRPVPQCPNGCGPIYSSHTCTVSALTRPLPGSTPAPRPARRLRVVETGLVPAPKGWRERADRATEGWQERLAARRRAEGVTVALYAVDELDEPSDDYSGEDWSL